MYVVLREQCRDHSRLLLLAHGEVPHQLASTERLCNVFARLDGRSSRLLLRQNRLQRCTMDCADDAKDSIPPGAKEGDAAVERAMAQVLPVPAIAIFMCCFIYEVYIYV